MPTLLRLALANALLLLTTTTATPNPLLLQRNDHLNPCIPTTGGPTPSCHPLIIGEKSITYRDGHLNGLLDELLDDLADLFPKKQHHKRTFSALYKNFFHKDIQHRNGGAHGPDGCVDNDDGTIELVANVCVSISGTNTIVKFDKIPKYTYKDLHVYLGESVPAFGTVENLPYTTKKGHCKVNHDGSATCTIPYSSVCGTTTYIATHADVQETGSNRESTKENLWGKGTAVNSKCSPSAQYSTYVNGCTWCPPVETRYCKIGAAFGHFPGKSEKLNDARWGWKQSFSVGELKNIVVVPLFTGAKNNDLTLPAVKNVGAVTLNMEGATGVKVNFRLKDGYDTQRLNYYVSCTNPDGGLADRPWDYGHDTWLPNETIPDVSHVDTVSLSCLNGATDATKVWVILYTETYFYPPRTEECPEVLH